MVCFGSPPCVTASSSKTPNDLYHALASNGLPATADAQAFVTELHSLVPRKSKSGGSSSKKHATTAVSGQGTLVNQKYALMLDDGDEDSTKKKKRKDKGKDKERVKEEKPSKSHRERDGERSERKDRDAERDRRDDGSRKIQRSTRKREVNGDEWVSDEEEKERERKRQREMSAEVERTFRLRNV
jgi:pre-mRNA-splicing factor ATP-dependent RNA helicase DHX16